MAAIAVAAPTNALTPRDNTLYIAGNNATELAQQYAPVFSLAPQSFAADDSSTQPMGFLDFSGYVTFIANLLYTANDFIQAAYKAIKDLNVNELNTAITNAIMGILKYLNAFLAATKQGTRFDKAVYAFIINSGVKDFLTNVGMFIVNLSNKILGSPLLQDIINLLKKLVNFLFGGKQAVQQTLGSEADNTGWDRALLAANSVEAAAQAKVDGKN